MRREYHLPTVCSLIAVSILVMPLAARAQQSQTSSYQALSDKFFELLQQDKSAEAIDYMFSSNVALAKMQDKADQLKAQFASLRTIAGPYVSHSLLVETKVSGMFVYQHYFVAYERQPISVRITYYKPDKTWRCQSLQFDTNVDDVIQKVPDEKIRME